MSVEGEFAGQDPQHHQFRGKSLPAWPRHPGNAAVTRENRAQIMTRVTSTDDLSAPTGRGQIGGEDHEVGVTGMARPGIRQIRGPGQEPPTTRPASLNLSNDGDPAAAIPVDENVVGQEGLHRIGIPLGQVAVSNVRSDSGQQAHVHSRMRKQQENEHRLILQNLDNSFVTDLGHAHSMTSTSDIPNTSPPAPDTRNARDDAVTAPRLTRYEI